MFKWILEQFWWNHDNNDTGYKEWSGSSKINLVDHKDKDRISIKVCSYFDLDLSVCFLLGIVPTGRDIKDQSNIVEFLWWQVWQSEDVENLWWIDRESIPLWSNWITLTLTLIHCLAWGNSWAQMGENRDRQNQQMGENRDTIDK